MKVNVPWDDKKEPIQDLEGERVELDTTYQILKDSNKQFDNIMF